MIDIKSLLIRKYNENDKTGLIKLWQDCDLIVPWNDPDRDIELKMSFQPDGLLLAFLENQLVGSVMAGYEGHRGWINYLAVSPSFQKLGIGKLLMVKAEELLRELGCPKINLQVRSTNIKVIEFYENLGYKNDNVIGLGKRL